MIDDYQQRSHQGDCEWIFRTNGSFDDADGVSVIINRYAEIHLFLFIFVVLKDVRIGVLVPLEDQLPGGRIYCHGDRVVLVEVPGSVLFVHGTVVAPTIAVIGNLYRSMVDLLKFIRKRLNLALKGDPNCHPPLDPIHAQLYRPLLVANARLNQRDQRVFVVRQVRHHQALRVRDLEVRVQKGGRELERFDGGLRRIEQ